MRRRKVGSQIKQKPDYYEFGEGGKAVKVGGSSELALDSASSQSTQKESPDQVTPAYMGADLHHTSSQSEATTTSNSSAQVVHMSAAADDQQQDEMLGWVNLDSVGANQTAPAQNPDLNPIVGHITSVGGCFIS
jgi:hypothetical protein